MNSAVYMDYASTTPTDPRVVEAMVQFLGPNGAFGNPASYWHCFGEEAATAVEQARSYVAELINAAPDEIIWTSGATESNNLALKGIAFASVKHGKHIVTSAMEHKAVLDTCLYLESQGFEVTYLKPQHSGLICPSQVDDALRPDTILVSLMHVNNEIGTITDVATIADVVRKRGIPFHTDAAQGVARLPLDTSTVPVDLISLSSHKMYGPKGIGALYIRHASRLDLQPQIHGGGHEGGLRSGTLPTHQIVGMGVAAHILKQQIQTDNAKQQELSKVLLDNLRQVDGMAINGDRRYCVPDIINLSFAGAESESLMMILRDIALSKGSACTSARVEPSHVLTAMGLSEDTAHSSLRLSLGRFTTHQEISYTSRKIAHAVRDLRAISFTAPLA